MPESVLEHGMPTLQEPVHVLVKFILYVAQDEKLLVMPEGGNIHIVPVVHINLTNQNQAPAFVFVISLSYLLSPP
ncbi:hypothetical protein L226DRAFT_570632 [Lentinus tigrinus ALCF2SS1-7]|uniref:uncharacterized protein n=1 Tax=Lentinus tigrinus ALCF2SS1-7 TaxID=1328758 RepID=UPI001165FB29|nr:hypothetical protein L226DRAFT_570632 [Lentinus tigrinus ALCF2SS1-7]